MPSSDFRVKKILDTLASPKIFFWTSMLIAMHFFLAAPYCKKTMKNGSFMELNNYLLLDWVRDQWANDLFVAFWLGVTFVLFFIIGLNICSRLFVECIFLFNSVAARNQCAAHSNGLLSRKILIFFIHASFLGLLFFYFISSLTGYKFVGPVVEPGQILTHASLPADLECLSVRKADKKMSKPEILFKVLDENGGTFTAPGWYRGVYYDVRGEIVSIPSMGSAGKNRNSFVLKLFVHKFNAPVFVILLAVWITSFVLYLWVRFVARSWPHQAPRRSVESISVCST